MKNIVLQGRSYVAMIIISLIVSACGYEEKRIAESWSDADIAFMSSFSLSSLPKLPEDLSNQQAGSEAAAKFGQKLFFDTRLSINAEVACSTCHQADKYFTDAKTIAVGVAATTKNTPTVVGTAYNEWLFWDGRKDSQWAQALGPLESLVEHGATRSFYAHVIQQFYADTYNSIFTALPEELNDTVRFPVTAGPNGNQQAQDLWLTMSAADQALITEVFVNIGKAIAAYQRKLIPAKSRFDDYVDALQQDRKSASDILSLDEAQGLQLFMGKANCSQCHTGPLFTNQGFHNIGLQPADPKQAELGRSVSVNEVAADEFNCLSEYSDADPAFCAELRHVKLQGIELIGAFKTPSLRNVSKTAPYMHAGQFKDLTEVLLHYNKAIPPFYDPEQHYEMPHSDLIPLKLSEEELAQLEAFLHSLDSEIAADANWLSAPD